MSSVSLLIIYTLLTIFLTLVIRSGLIRLAKKWHKHPNERVIFDIVSGVGIHPNRGVHNLPAKIRPRLFLVRSDQATDQ